VGTAPDVEPADTRVVAPDDRKLRVVIVTGVVRPLGVELRAEKRGFDVVGPFDGPQFLLARRRVERGDELAVGVELGTKRDTLWRHGEIWQRNENSVLSSDQVRGG